MELNRAESAKLYEQAQTLIPGGVNSPVRAFRSVGGTPLFIKKGQGSLIWDEDGNEFIDFCGSWGPLISGHAHPEIIKTVKETVDFGTSFGAPNRHEVVIAQTMIDHLPHVKMVRFVNSGTEAVMSAIRAARGFTGRDVIVKFDGCYHGHVDSLLVNAGSGLATFGISSTPGVPQSLADLTVVLPLDDETALESCLTTHHEKIAAVIIEPIPANNGLLIQRKTFLQTLRHLCTKYGIVLIFDEVISGFRVGFEGAAGYYQIQPDMVTYGKIIGGGFPVGAYGGRSDIMKVIAPIGKVYQAGTLAGNPVAMAAGFAQLQLLLMDGFYQRLEKKSAYFEAGLLNIKNKYQLPIELFRMGSLAWIYFGVESSMTRADKIKPETMEKFKIFHRYCLEHGIYLAPSGYEVTFISDAHSYEQLDKTLMVMEQAMKEIF